MTSSQTPAWQLLASTPSASASSSAATRRSAVLPLAALLAMLVVLFLEAWPAIRFNGLGILTGSAWNVGNAYAGAPSKSGGVLHLAGATTAPGPSSSAPSSPRRSPSSSAFRSPSAPPILVVEKLARRIARWSGLCLEILAGIPSAVIGLWGVLTFGPWLASDIYQVLSHMPNVPVFGYLPRRLRPQRSGAAHGGLVLSAMIIPIIAATTRDLLRQVPETTKEGAEALGMTDAEVFGASRHGGCAQASSALASSVSAGPSARRSPSPS